MTSIVLNFMETKLKKVTGCGLSKKTVRIKIKTLKNVCQIKFYVCSPKFIKIGPQKKN